MAHEFQGATGSDSSLAWRSWANYDMTIIHRPGLKHQNADALSRVQVESACDEYRLGADLSSLPCKGCRYCQRAHQKWGDFVEKVDDVIPLASKKPVVEDDLYPDIRQLFQVSCRSLWRESAYWYNTSPTLLLPHPPKPGISRRSTSVFFSSKRTILDSFGNC